MRWVRILAGIAVVFVAALVVAVITLNSMDWSAYQRPVVDAVESATGRTLAIGGELRLQIGLSPAVTVGNVTFSNAEWGSQPEMASLEHFAVRLRLLPLFFGRIEVGRVELRGLDLLLETDSQGLGNWDFSAVDAAATPASPKPDRPNGEPSEGPVPAEEIDADSLSALVEEALIEGFVVTYRDGATGDEQQFRVDRLFAQQSGPDAPLSLEVLAQLNSAPIELDAELAGALEVPNGGPLGVDLELHAGGAVIRVKGKVEQPLGPQGPKGIDLAISAEGDSVSDWSPLAGSSLPAIGPYALSGAVSDDGTAYRVADLKLSMGSSNLGGQLRADLAGPRPRIEAAIASPRLDLADFEGEPGEVPAAPAGPGAPAGAPESAPKPAAAGDGSPREQRLFSKKSLELDGLNSVDAAVVLDVTQLIANGIALDNLHAELALRDGVLNLQPVTVDLAGGTIELDLRLDGSSHKAGLDTDLSIRQVDVGSLLKALEATDVLSGGALDLDLDVSGQGKSVRKIMGSLDGTLSLSMGRGSIRDEWASLVLSDVGRLISKDAGSGKAKLNCILGEFQVTDGIADTRRLVLDTKPLAVFGSGQVNLKNEELDLHFEPLPKKAAASSITPPAWVGGTLAAPEYGIDREELANKALGVLADLLAGNDLGGESTKSEKGVEGCIQLAVAREEEAAAQPAGAGDPLSAEASAQLKKQKKKLKKQKKKLVKDAEKQLEKLFK